jgi:hypothetical protein
MFSQSTTSSTTLAPSLLSRLSAHSCDAAGPLTLDARTALQGKSKLGEELNGGIKVLHHDANVIHTLDCHDVSLAPNADLSGRVAMPLVLRFNVGYAAR